MTPSFVFQSETTVRPESLYRPKPSDVFKRRCLSRTDKKHPEVAELMGSSGKHFSRFINGHVRVSVEFARKLESVTNISAAAWLHYQMQYDLYETADEVLPKRSMFG